MSRIKCLVVDDEFLARTLLKEYIDKIPHLELVAMCANGMEAMNAIRQEEVDLLFLDIQMPDIRGVDLVRALTTKPLIVFTTAYSEHAVESYDLQVLDYLLKPIEFERFLQAVNKASDFLKLTEQADETRLQNDSFLVVKADHGKHKVLHSDILYIEGLKEYVAIHKVDGSKVIALMTLVKLEEILPGRFLRIHKSFIVCLDKVTALYGNQVVLGTVKIPIGKSFKEKVARIIFKK